MFKHRPTLAIYILTLVLLFLLQKQYSLSSWIYLIPSLPYFALQVYASLNIRFNFFTTAINSVDIKEKKIALTFDDGPEEQYTEEVLEILKQRSVPASFFLIGKKIEGKENIIEAIHRDGHLIGNHSFCHSWTFEFMPSFLVRKDINKTSKLINNVIGKDVNFFRPPFGVTTPAIGWALSILKIKTIGWSIRTFDTLTADDDLILQRIEAGLHPGAIILLHDILPKQKNLLPKVLDLLEKHSYEVVALDKLIGEKPYI